MARPEDRTGRLSQLWLVEPASGRKRLLRKDDAVQPQWSPSGRHIAYWAIDLDGHRDIWTLPAGGGQAVRITRDEYLNWNPVWSPDGAYLYFCSNRGGSTAIWRVPMKESTGEARGAPELIRTPAPYTAHLSFSRDGRRMAYVHQVTTGRLCTVKFDPVTETRSERAEGDYAELEGGVAAGALAGRQVAGLQLDRTAGASFRGRRGRLGPAPAHE